jgi:hypothetical protein
MLASGNSGLATCSGVSGGAVIIVGRSGQPWLLNESMPLFLGIKHAYMNLRISAFNSKRSFLNRLMFGLSTLYWIPRFCAWPFVKSSSSNLRSR